VKNSLKEKIIKQLGIKPVYPLDEDRVVYYKNVFKHRRIFLIRDRLYKKGDSGWYIGPVNKEVNLKNPKEFKSMTVRTLSKTYPHLYQVMMLPLNYIVVFDRDEIISISDTKDNELWDETIKTD
jgi:hypothetical protein